MRARQELDDAISAYRALESAVDDNAELIELGEAEGDDDVVKEAEAAIAEAHRLAAKRQPYSKSGASVKMMELLSTITKLLAPPVASSL